MLNHETDVIGNSQDVGKEKFEQCHCPGFFFFLHLCDDHLFGVFSSQKLETAWETLAGIGI